MKRIVLAIGLVFCAGAQVPGVSLAGIPASPIVVNLTGKSILAYVVRFRNGQDETIAIVGDTQNLRRGNAPLPAAFSHKAVLATQAELDLVVFEDGTVAGPDAGESRAIIAAFITAEKQLAEAVATRQAGWDQVSAVMAQKGSGNVPPPYTAENATRALAVAAVRHGLAQDLWRAHIREGDAKAFEIAEWSRKLPVVGAPALAQRIYKMQVPNPLRLFGPLAHALGLLYNYTGDSSFGFFGNGDIVLGQWAPSLFFGSQPGTFNQNAAYCATTPVHYIHQGLAQYCACDNDCYVELLADQGQQLGWPAGYVLVGSDNTTDPQVRGWVTAYGTQVADCRPKTYWYQGPGSASCTP